MNLFDRAPMEYRPAIEEALRFIPNRVRQLIDARFMCGVDPGFVGLHGFRAETGLPYSEVAHACYSFQTADGRQTIVLPDGFFGRYPDPVGVIIHEYGHLYDEATGFQLPDVPASTDYSYTDRWEAFAESFRIQCAPPTGEWADWSARESQRPLRELMGVVA